MKQTKFWQVKAGPPFDVFRSALSRSALRLLPSMVPCKMTSASMLFPSFYFPATFFFFWFIFLSLVYNQGVSVSVSITFSYDIYYLCPAFLFLFCFLFAFTLFLTFPLSDSSFSLSLLNPPATTMSVFLSFCDMLYTQKANSTYRCISDKPILFG